MRRYAYNLLVGGSTLLLIATIALWCRSALRVDRVIYTFHNPSGAWTVRNHAFRLSPGVAKAVEAVSVASGGGRIVLARIGFTIPTGQRGFPAGEPEPDYSNDYPYLAASKHGFALEHPGDSHWIGRRNDIATLGFSRMSASWMLSYAYWAAPTWNVYATEYEIPYWFIALIFAIAPAARLIPIVRSRRRFARGRCPACGYDLRATPERCPECGANPVVDATKKMPAVVVHS